MRCWHKRRVQRGRGFKLFAFQEYLGLYLGRSLGRPLLQGSFVSRALNVPSNSPDISFLARTISRTKRGDTRACDWLGYRHKTLSQAFLAVWHADSSSKGYYASRRTSTWKSTHSCSKTEKSCPIQVTDTCRLHGAHRYD